MKRIFEITVFAAISLISIFSTSAVIPVEWQISGAHRQVLSARGMRAIPVQTQRQIAITFDDLPSVPTHDVKELRALTTKLIETLKRNKVPAIGFVNEGKLHQRSGAQAQPDDVEARTAVLKLWVDAGFELGNHTYSHLDMFSSSAEKFERDLIAGEQITKKLLAAKGMKLRYFRHPFLNTGASLEMKNAFDKILADRNYIVAPVTLDNQDYVFAAIYADALKNGDRAMMKRVGEAYVPYMEAYFEFYERQSSTLLGYEIKQILLVHANMLNADYFDGMIAMMKKRGYQFISLEEALGDKAYKLEDKFAGRAGISWLQRWAMTQKHQPTIDEFKLEPTLPKFIKQAYDARKR
jgi:peptidoglycan/xylan/chitin deacetylase (PgdA/CDA1 family)